MPYDEMLAERVRTVLTRRRSLVEKKMFGGVGWLLNGNMCVGVWKRSLIARLGDGYSEALREPHVRPFDITGKSLGGWVMVDLEGLAADDALKEWVKRCIEFVKTLPRKE
jgi:hypothetical protein